MSLRIRAFVVMLGLVVASCEAAAAQAEAESVSLRFGWPEGTVAHVEQEWSRTRSTSERNDTIRVASQHRIQMLSHAEGHFIRTDGFTQPQIVGAQSDTSAFLQRLFGHLAALTPSYVISPAGEFLRVADIEGMKAAVDAVFDPLFREWEAIPPQATQMLQAMLSEESLTASAAQEWNLMVGMWEGADWEIGAVYSLEAEEPSPVFPGFMIPMIYEFSATRRVPCEEGASQNRCVELSLYSTADAGAMRGLIQHFMQQVAGEEGAEIVAAMESMEVEHELTVITDPRTLLPYRVELVKHVQVAAQPTASDGGGVVVQRDRRVARYSYPR